MYSFKVVKLGKDDDDDEAEWALVQDTYNPYSAFVVCRKVVESFVGRLRVGTTFSVVFRQDGALSVVVFNKDTTLQRVVGFLNGKTFHFGIPAEAWAVRYLGDRGNFTLVRGVPKT